jgi:diguanylate cyclase (GGDEF)-like protein
LRAEIDTELKRPSPWAFSAVLENQYRSRNNIVRRGWLSVAMAIAAFAVLLGVIFDLRAGLPVFDAALGPRAGAALVCLLAALALYRVRQTWLEVLLLAVPVLAVLVVWQLTTELALARDPAYAQVLDRGTLIEALGLAALMLLPHWRFPSVLVTGVLSAIALPVLAVVPPQAAPVRPHLVALALAVCVILVTIYESMQQEKARRALFLHVVRHELSGEALDQANAELLRLSTTDLLTGFANRRHFDAEVARMWRDRGRTNIGIALIEIDSFSDYIEHAGSTEADHTLREVARTVSNGLRQDWDRPGRWQDAAFAAMLPGVGREELYTIGQRLCEAVRQLAIPYVGEPGRFVSISVGLAWSSGATGHMTAAHVLQDADAALFAAKSLGTNRVVLAGDKTTQGPAPMFEAPYR